MHIVFILGLALALAVFPPAARAEVVYVGLGGYRLENGRRHIGPWEVAETISLNKDVAIVVMEDKADQRLVEDLIKALETINVPVLFTKLKDYKAFQSRGLLTPR